MKTLTTIFQTLTLSLFIIGATQSMAAGLPGDRDGDSSRGPSRIIDNTIRYAQSIYPIDRGGFIYPMALIGGNVRFDGNGPVYVTLHIGGQTFTALTDSRGDYSFFAYANGSGHYDVQAWVADEGQQHALTKTGEVSVQK
ncbi:MAG: hypothetical protein ABIR96_05535 [Bdellovibrionota bacterium]